MKKQAQESRQMAVGNLREQEATRERHYREIQQLRAELVANRPANMEDMRETQHSLRQENTVLKKQVAELAHKTVTGVYAPLLDMATAMARLGKNEDGSDDGTFKAKVDYLVKCSMLGQPMTARELTEKTAPIANRLWAVYTRAADKEQALLTAKLVNQKRPRK